MATVDQSPVPVENRFRQILAASIGNLVEWYDWYAYTFLATFVAAAYFPTDAKNPLVPLLATFAVFAVGFFMRPIGGLLLGSFADRFGRRAALTLTIATMGVGSLLIALGPTYAQVGLAAPVLLIVARLVQGLSIGGEFAASTTFLVESAPPQRRGLFSSFQYVSTTVGQLIASGLAAVLVYALGAGPMGSYGWRIMFVVGALASFVGLWIRRGAVETHPEAAEFAAHKERRPGPFEFLVRYPRKALLIVGITIAGTISYYTWTTYLPTYAQTTFKYDPGPTLIVSTIALVFFGILNPVMGTVSDRVGRKPLLLVSAGGLAVLTVPLLLLAGKGIPALLVVALIAMVFLSGYTSIAAAVMVEIFPARVRAAGIGFPYSFTVALFGGTAPYVGTALLNADRGFLFPWYIVVLTAISFVVYLFLKETRGERLPR